MSFIKPDKKTDTVDPMRELMCSVGGCQNRWSVKLDRPMCSFHQWNEKFKPVYRNYTEPNEPDFGDNPL